MEESEGKANIGPPPVLAPAISKSISGRQYSLIVGDQIHFRDESNESAEFEPRIADYLPLLTPKLTKAGKVAVRQPHIPKRSLKWWKAQCAFRGLAVSGKLNEIQNRLRSNEGKGLSEMMKDAREIMSKEYLRNNEIALTETWLKANNSARAKLWPKRLLSEFFDTRSKTSRGALIVEVDNWGDTIAEACKTMNLHCELRKLPNHVTGQRLAFIGRNKQVAQVKVMEADREVQSAALKAKEEREEREQEAQRDFEERFEIARPQRKRSKSPWNVDGRWIVSCPYMEEQWGSTGVSGDECDLEIGFTQPTDTGLVQMYAEFDFIAITGIMRFVNRFASESVSSQKSKLDGSPCDDLISKSDEDEMGYEIEDEDETTTPAQFLFPTSSLPSSKSQDFAFRWRGEETGEGEIQLDSDRELCEIRFESSGALTGTFISDLTGKIKFKGYKEDMVDVARGSNGVKGAKSAYWKDPADIWNERSAAAHEHARVGRWG